MYTIIRISRITIPHSDALPQMLSQHQMSEQSINEKLLKVQTEKNSFSERIAALQRTLGNFEFICSIHYRDSIRSNDNLYIF